ncbi:putative protein C5orf42 [Liparis tanakae]|uniref:Protein JBTS17 n=1 Tax=Liparis tanakae TaxID=230148 RepID=A0A4Z2ITE0_9TELE|nr:putative protein C5orf42 [Liparis tanakae]
MEIRNAVTGSLLQITTAAWANVTLSEPAGSQAGSVLLDMCSLKVRRAAKESQLQNKVFGDELQEQDYLHLKRKKRQGGFHVTQLTFNLGCHRCSEEKESVFLLDDRRISEINMMSGRTKKRTPKLHPLLNSVVTMASSHNRYNVQWATKTYPMSRLAPPCQPVKSRGALMSAFSPDGCLLAIVLNQRQPKATQVLFVSTQNFVSTSSGLGGCGSKKLEIPSKYIRAPVSAGKGEASLSSSSLSVRDVLRQRYSVTWHPRLLYLIVSDGYMATVMRVLEKPSANLILKTLLKDTSTDLEKASRILDKSQDQGTLGGTKELLEKVQTFFEEDSDVDGPPAGSCVEDGGRLEFASMFDTLHAMDTQTDIGLTLLSFLPWDNAHSDGSCCLGLVVELSKRLARLLLTPQPESHQTGQHQLSSHTLSSVLLILQLVSDALDNTYSLQQRTVWSPAEKQTLSQPPQFWPSDAHDVPLLQDEREEKSRFVNQAQPVPQRPSSRLVRVWQWVYKITLQYMDDLQSFKGCDGWEEEQQQSSLIMSQIQMALQATGERLEEGPALLSYPGLKHKYCDSDRSVFKETRLCLALLYSLLSQYRLKESQELGDHMARLILHRAGDQKDNMTGMTADSFPCPWLPMDLHPDAALAVVQTLGRFMASYFTNQPLYILPPHHVAILPPLHLPQGRLVPLSQEEVSRAVRQQQLSEVWTVDYAQDLLLLGGLLPEAVWLAYHLGDWKTAASLSLAYTNYCTDNFDFTRLRRRELHLPAALEPESIFEVELECLLGHKADFQERREHDGDKSFTDPSEGEDWDLLQVSIQEILKASVMAGVNLMSSPLSSLLDTAKDLCSVLPTLVPNGLYLPSPPLYCPQPSPNTQITGGSEVRSSCVDALRWVSRFLPFSCFLNAEEILQDILLSLVSELPPLSLVADALVRAFPEEEESVRVPLREKYNSLLHKLRGCNVLEGEKEEVNELMMILIQDKFRQRRKHLGRLARHLAPLELHLWEAEEEQDDRGSKHGTAVLRQLSLGTSLSTSTLTDCGVPLVYSDGDTVDTTSEAISPEMHSRATIRGKKAKVRQHAKKTAVKIESAIPEESQPGDAKENEQPALPVVGTWEFELEDEEYLNFLELFLSYVLEKDSADGGDPGGELPLLKGFSSQLRERELHSLTFDVLTTIHRRQRDVHHPARKHSGHDPPVFRAGCCFKPVKQGATPDLQTSSVWSEAPTSRTSLSVTSLPRQGKQKGLFGLRQQRSSGQRIKGGLFCSEASPSRRAFPSRQPSENSTFGSSTSVEAVIELQQGLDPKLEAQFPELGRLLEWMVRWADRRALQGHHGKKRKERGGGDGGTADEGVVIRVKASAPAVLTSLSLLERRYTALLGSDRYSAHLQVPETQWTVAPVLQPEADGMLERESSVDTGYPGSANTPIIGLDFNLQQEELSM